jgi:hypothetical protein
VKGTPVTEDLLTAQPVISEVGARSDADWWRQATVYQIYPRSFADANGDGIGDLRGIISNSFFGGSAWQRITELDGTPGQWYFHLFAKEQPDLNWDNREVHDDFLTTLRFWSDRGVAGFRVDVADSLKKDLAHPAFDTLRHPRKEQEFEAVGTLSGTATTSTTCTPSGAPYSTLTTLPGWPWPRPGSGRTAVRAKRPRTGSASRSISTFSKRTSTPSSSAR